MSGAFADRTVLTAKMPMPAASRMTAPATAAVLVFVQFIGFKNAKG